MKRILLMPAAVLAFAVAPAAASAAPASFGGEVLQADLAPLNGSTAQATATVTIDGALMTVDITGSGYTPGESPHAQHIHGVVGQNNTCPTAAQDTDGDGIVTTSEGQAAYGPILVSLTTEGDMSAEQSALAVDRMPVADAGGNLSYHRTFDVPPNLGDDIDALHVVQHGVDFDGSGAYDGARMSDLDPSLPAEATDPATCGELVALPSGGVQTGGGGATAGPDHGDAGTTSNGGGAVSTALLALGGAAAAAAVGGGFLLRRRSAA